MMQKIFIKPMMYPIFVSILLLAICSISYIGIINSQAAAADATAAATTASAQTDITGKSVAKQIRINGGDFPPFIMNTNRAGAFVEITNTIFKSAGYTVEYTSYPFKRAMTMLENGAIDGCLYVSYTKDRTRFLDYPEKMYNTKISVFGLRDGKNIKISKLADLKGSTVGVLMGSVWDDELEKYKITHQGTPNIAESLKKLFKKRVDFIIGVKDIILYKAKTIATSEQLKNIYAVEPPLLVDASYLAFSKASKNSKQYVLDFNKGLNQLKKDGTYGRILKKYGLDTQ